MRLPSLRIAHWLMIRNAGDGSKQTIDLEGKWSSTIFQELMDAGGGSSWEKWKRERATAGLPVVDVPSAKAVAPKAPTWTPKQKSKKEQAPEEELILDPSKTGAAAILP